MHILGLSTLFSTTLPIFHIASDQVNAKTLHPSPNCLLRKTIKANSPSKPLPAERTPVLHLVKSLGEDTGQPSPRWCGRLGGETLCVQLESKMILCPLLNFKGEFGDNFMFIESFQKAVEKDGTYVTGLVKIRWVNIYKAIRSVRQSPCSVSVSHSLDPHSLAQHLYQKPL